ncbi:MAG: SLBB domain-containing protein [Cyanobacteria bacterium J06649_5]
MALLFKPTLPVLCPHPPYSSRWEQCLAFRLSYLWVISVSLGGLVAIQLVAGPVKAAETNELDLPQIGTPSSPSTSTSVPDIVPASTQPDSSLPASYGYPAIDSYVLGAGDEVQLDVFRLPDYSGEYEVLINGALNLPMVGQVVVSGLTIEQAEQVISQAYAQRLRRPIIDLFLVEPRPLRVGIAGEVSQPGEYILQREGTQFPSLVSALETAGGITQSADLRQVVIQRPTSTGSRQTIVADLWQFLQSGDLRYNTALRDGDTVYIPTRENFDSVESLQLAAASFAADDSRPLNVAVVGQVFRPGPHLVSNRSGGGGNSGGAQPTVTQAIQTAGGIQPDANIREVQVYRRTRDGSEQVIAVNLWQLLTDGDITEDIVLQEGDTVVIPEADSLASEEVAEVVAASFSPETIRINVVGEVDRPGSIEVSPNTPLSQGVLAAGGFNNRARRGNVELIRLNPNGTATRSSLEVDFARGIDSDENPLLQNNDVIVVGRSGRAALSDALDSVVRPLGRAFSLFTIPASIFNLFD